eukprot:COSAG04_NODE_18552_length_438_cov_3.353982_1_plen_76_part_01
MGYSVVPLRACSIKRLLPGQRGGVNAAGVHATQKPFYASDYRNGRTRKHGHLSDQHSSLRISRARLRAGATNSERT